MSHTTAINSVVISDIGALRAAVNELKAEGINCDLVQNCKPRAYYSNQVGMEQAPFVLQLNDASYDVGLYPTDGGYEARTDFYGGTVESQLGVTAPTEEEKEQARMGKLFQRYAVCAAENHAAMSGYSAIRSTKEDGTIQLVLSAG